MKLVRKAIPDTGVYQHHVDGKPISEFSVRPFIGRKRTWRKLEAISLRKAIIEANKEEWRPRAKNFAAIAELYIARDCPSLRNPDRSDNFIKEETFRANKLIQFFGDFTGEEIDLPLLIKYKDWRLKHLRKSTDGKRDVKKHGLRAVVKDGNTLSNILNFAVAEGLITVNKVYRGRPNYAKSQNVRHCREVAPESADVIHQLADALMNQVKSEVLAWQLLFAMFTGCRTSELLRLRLDAKNEDHAGYIADGYLYLNRSKGGVDEYSVIGTEFAQMIECFQRWHRKRHPERQWFFPSHMGDQPVSANALNHALTRLCPRLKLPHITPHGLRSYYVTKRRSDGAKEIVIAGEIGDQTVGLLQSTYGKRPRNWHGGKALKWVPEEGLPAWHRWESLDKKLVTL